MWESGGHSRLPVGSGATSPQAESFFSMSSQKTAFWSMKIRCLQVFLYFFLPLVPIGVAGGHSCLSAARWVAWRRDIP